MKREENRQLLELAAKIPGLNTQYLVESYARQFDWLDPKLLFPGQGQGRSPERPMAFTDLMRMSQGRFEPSAMSEGLGGMM